MSKKVEIKRQALHIILGIATILLIQFNIISKWFVLGCAIIVSILFFISLKTSIPFLDNLVKHFERPTEKHKYEGLLTFFLGMFAVLFFFDKNTALAAIAIMVFGDSASTIFGKLFGKTRIPWSSKTIMGSLFGIIFSFWAAAIFVNWLHALIASIVAVLVESFDQNLLDINDNILMPVSAAIVLALLKFFGA